MTGPARLADRFEILAECGEGAFAHVYRARELATGRKVALKVLKESLRADAEVLERFRREVFAVASIDSPHVVALYDFGISGDEMFIAMEYVDGPTLRDLLQQRPWSAAAVHMVVGQIAQAIAAAHEKNIVHRDLKPENVVLVKGKSGRQAKVLDFGLAKLADLERNLELEPLTKAGMCFGTPHYMGPEQVQGRAADSSADLWALTVMAYEMLAGSLPWDGSDPRDLFMSIIARPVPPLTTLHPSVTRRSELERFFARALSRTRAERPPDAAALFRAFREALLGGAAPGKEGVFAGIVSAEFALPQADEEVTNVDGRSGAPALLADTLSDESDGAAPSRSSRRHRSEWLPSLPAMPLPTEAAAATTSEAPRARGPSPIGRWFVALAIVLVAAAAVAGYFVGKR